MTIDERGGLAAECIRDELDVEDGDGSMPAVSCRDTAIQFDVWLGGKTSMAKLAAAGIRPGYGDYKASSKKTRASSLIIKAFEGFTDAENARV